jgi:hypothetical protein
MGNVPRCRTVTVHTFCGDRSPTFVRRVLKALEDHRNGRGHGPSRIECLLYSGHTGVSLDNRVIYGFNADGGKDPLWRILNKLRNGDAYPGVVLDDTTVFANAGQKGLVLLKFDVILPEPRFQAFRRKVRAERKQSRYSYGFPNGNGDCNCTTWLERLGLPLLSGSMDEFTALPGFVRYPARRFGQCE